ncbi:MAG TPA: serine/threonine-protein kinase, partial [Thermoleophilaceae bacterium]
MSGVLEAGTDIGGYRIRSLLGEGRMGNVYLAEGSDGRVCALKVLSERASDDPDAGARFKREAEYAAALAHPNIVELYEAGQTAEGTAFFAMRYVDGPDLGALIAREGALNPARALAILGQIGDALDAAHGKGLVHRDVKPGNILVEERAGEPYAYLTDFGLSKNPNEDSLA